MLPSVENTLIEYTTEEVTAFDLTNFVKSITRGENVDKDNIDEWINSDGNDPSFEHLTDEQIVGLGKTNRALGTLSLSEEENNDT